jgi:hypothetical protein
LLKGDVVVQINGEQGAAFEERFAEGENSSSKILRVLRTDDNSQVHLLIGSASDPTIRTLLFQNGKMPSEATHETKLRVAKNAREAADQARKKADEALITAQKARQDEAAATSGTGIRKSLHALADAKLLAANAAQYSASLARDIANAAEEAVNEK